MKVINVLIICVFFWSFTFGQNQTIPHLEKKNGNIHLVIDNKPFLMFSGELHNSSTGSAHYMRTIWKRMADQKLNTVIAPVSWELVEPTEGKFDFSLVDSMILGAQKDNLKLVVLWFGSWKNGKSTYVPEWVKTNTKRFPLAIDKKGNTFNTLSTFGEQTLEADIKAFGRLMQRIKEVDSEHQTVITIQIENEVGLLDYMAAFRGTSNNCMRDFSPEATKSFNDDVPAELMLYLQKNKKTLHPAITKTWADNGYKSEGTWEEIFGRGVKYEGEEWKTNYSYLTEEIFTTWNYASYMGKIAQKGKEIYPLPMYVNAWLKKAKQRDPGLYPSGGPQAHVIDIYHAAAPAIDFIAPDIYAVEEFDWICEEYSRSGNPLFIPETKVDTDGASRAFYAFGKYNVICYAPFGIDGGGLLNSADTNDKSFQKVYACLNDIEPFIQKYYGTEKMTGLFIDSQKNTDKVEMGNYSISIERPSYLQAMGLLGTEYKGTQKPGEIASGAIVFQLDDNEFLVAGGVGGTLIRISKGASNPNRKVDYASVDEVTFENGKMLTHRLNGDETAFGGPVILPGEAKIFRIKMYGY